MPPPIKNFNTLFNLAPKFRGKASKKLRESMGVIFQTVDEFSVGNDWCYLLKHLKGVRNHIFIVSFRKGEVRVDKGEKKSRL
ncbi:MAG: hypothetical protein H0A76_12895 [Candidatus Thiodubiliella endoseptemdiera]|uniref:Uncharacterized protein n=1 Tax=Candidatus Thiodubiliella endoseptemdiera TaxID=2738886 RepID=A0A853F6H5_9GAMM|nr:hypothetical protein [Candidatus Thiodubiliella endoseptemdiera]